MVKEIEIGHRRAQSDDGDFSSAKAHLDIQQLQARRQASETVTENGTVFSFPPHCTEHRGLEGTYTKLYGIAKRQLKPALLTSHGLSRTGTTSPLD